MGATTPTTAGFITVAAAADELGVTPYEVMRLIQAGELDGLVLVQTSSLNALKERSA